MMFFLFLRLGRSVPKCTQNTLLKIRYFLALLCVFLISHVKFFVTKNCKLSSPWLKLLFSKFTICFFPNFSKCPRAYYFFYKKIKVIFVYTFGILKLLSNLIFALINYFLYYLNFKTDIVTGVMLDEFVTRKVHLYYHGLFTL